MVRKTLLIALAMGLAASTARAQNSKLEFSATAGYTFSDGVSGETVPVPGGAVNRIDPNDAFSWGLRGAYLLGRNSEVGFLFNLQSTELEASGTTTITVGDQSVYNYHGYYAYSFADVDAPARPYFLVGLGATSFSAVNTTVDGEAREVGGGTKFSGTLALGLKAFVFGSPKFGLRAEARYTPTYIKSDPGGWWCGYWGCYVVENAQYANQFELSAGIIFRP
jgi:hypothetical protein